MVVTLRKDGVGLVIAEFALPQKENEKNGNLAYGE